MASSRQQPTEEERAARDVFARLAASADEFEGYRHPHAERIAAVADALAKLFNFGRADRASLRIAALAHDLGEAAMRRDYIKRADALTDEERLDLSRHPVIGEQESARAGADRAAQLTVRWSHEWWNGCGYPDALRRDQIPLAARILRVADAYCALTDDRPYRHALAEDEARRHLAEWSGIEFDPRVVRAFLALHGLPELRSHARRDAEADQNSSQRISTDTSDSTPRDTGEADQVAGANDQIIGDGASSLHDAAGGDVRARGDGDAEERGHDDRSLGGRVPEAGVNPYASASDEKAADAAANEVADGSGVANNAPQSDVAPRGETSNS
ncbi:MAG: HD domain-containing protein [Acidobacteriota bacterium]|nr:HD domain-containing protein [Acidobacteriota bacterium]